MAFWQQFDPRCWRSTESPGLDKPLFNYRCLWKQAAIMSMLIVLLPLLLFTIYDYRVTGEAFEAEALARSARYVAKTRRTVSFLLSKKIFALQFIANDTPYPELLDGDRVTELLGHLNQGLGLFVDLGVIDEHGRQLAYAGPYALEEADYSRQPWFREVQGKGIYVSNVFMGLRNQPHIVIAVRKNLANGSFFVLRTAVSLDSFTEILTAQQSEGAGDAFLINSQGQLQTPSSLFGPILSTLPLTVPQPSSHTEVYLTDDRGQRLDQKEQAGILPTGAVAGPLIVAYAYVTDSPFILMLVSQRSDLLGQWQMVRAKLLIFLACTVIIILLVLICVVTYLVSAIHVADQNRVMALHEIEYSEKMAVIGRLAAGIAHEINNPLAIINEKAGLIQDLFQLKQEYQHDARLAELVAAILASVDRCALITRRLLNFARQGDGKAEAIDLRVLVNEVLSFLGKEPEYRSITIEVAIDAAISGFVSHRGKLQQILLNIIKNAFAAVADGGRLAIRCSPSRGQGVTITITDNGCGIPAEELQRIFEPFFTTRAGRGGTGLGLAITYNLVTELGGTIAVTSTQGEGTCFTLTFPLQPTTAKE